MKNWQDWQIWGWLAQAGVALAILAFLAAIPIGLGLLFGQAFDSGVRLFVENENVKRENFQAYAYGVDVVEFDGTDWLIEISSSGEFEAYNTKTGQQIQVESRYKFLSERDSYNEDQTYFINYQVTEPVTIKFKNLHDDIYVEGYQQGDSKLVYSERIENEQQVHHDRRYARWAGFIVGLMISLVLIIDGNLF